MQPVPRAFLTILLVTLAMISPSESLERRDNCRRPCVAGAVPETCRYEFIVRELPNVNSICNANPGNVSDGPTCPAENFGKSVLAINGRSPGPAIEICLGDSLEVIVVNKLANAELSLHWHGIRQANSAHMDGVPMVTQCPVLPYSVFRYEMKPEHSGTFFYHAHSVVQQRDGLYGALIVREPETDPIPEVTLLLSSRLRRPLTHLKPALPSPIELLINGESEPFQLSVTSGQHLLLRLINTNAMACPVSIAVSAHELQVVAVDGSPIGNPTSASHIILFPGERIDAVLEADRPAGRYLFSVQGLGDCRGIVHSAVLSYDKSSAALMNKPDMHLSAKEVALFELGYDCDRVERKVVCALDLKGSAKESSLEEPEETIYVPFDVNSFANVEDGMTDYGYNIYGFTYYPAYLSLSESETKLAQINGMTFKYPSSPLLSQPENTPEETICSLERTGPSCDHSPLFCECLLIAEVPFNKTIELLLIDEGFGGNASHTFHVHGYTVSVVGRGSFGHPVNKEDIVALNRKGLLSRNQADAPKKDSFTVPNKGYLILRFQSDNLGYWLWEARATGISPTVSGPGMQFLMRVGSRENLPMVPIDFPSCGNNKGPDLIFENH